MALGTNFAFTYSDGANELSSIQVKGVEIDAVSFQDGTGITEATLNQFGRALEDFASTVCGHSTVLIGIRSLNESSVVPVTP